ncbi:18 kDa heat shock protein [bacterium BMS3Abin05]|nr:18 kDa heat shock protein [bacterium BMS3Abin05]GBE28892.1 18 kDa heat shock protein [bacterium BMS3Bbin03]HDZ12735.1 Hsp20/alpha crystallin family protein [Bacteroidota bacterium]
MAIVRWRPTRDILGIRDEMDRLFDEFFGTLPEKFAGENVEGVWLPAVDISETEHDLIVTAELPGIKKDALKLSVQDNILTIKGEKKQEKETKDENYHRIERSYGAFQRTFSLPAIVDATKIKATFKDGVLKIRLPKKEEAKTKEIPIATE